MSTLLEYLIGVTCLTIAVTWAVYLWQNPEKR